MTQTAFSSAIFQHDKVNPEFNQYWYSAHTIDTLISEVRHHAIACAFLSCPSLFFTLDSRKGNETPEEDARYSALRANSRVFEFDKQWSSDAGYVFYDFHKPEQIPIQYMGTFDYIVADPPFITEDVWQAYVTTCKLLLKEGGKLLFTTVLENHTMLEGCINGPLFIPEFRPCVRNLTYQYVCFLSYDATKLQFKNSELLEDPEDAKVLAGIRMANDLRHSELEFALQMERRNRAGEAQLPTKAHEEDLKRLEETPIHVSEAPRDLSNVPLEKMRWGYIPEGLTVYANGSDEMPSEDAAATGSAETRDYGEAHNTAMSLRGLLDTFKGNIDKMQSLMDSQMKLRHQRMKARKELAMLTESDAASGKEEIKKLEATVEETSKAIDVSEETRKTQLDSMAALATQIETSEAALAALQSAAAAAAANGETVTPAGTSSANHTPYESAMVECIAAYRTVEAKKTALQELAADATRKFKSPLFNRMKELLQDMKDIKKMTA